MTETRLRQARLLQRKTLRGTARKSKLDSSTVIQAERGRNRSLRVLRQLAETLDLKDLQDAIATIDWYTEPVSAGGER